MVGMIDLEKIALIIFEIGGKIDINGKITMSFGQWEEFNKRIKQEFGDQLNDIIKEETKLIESSKAEPPALEYCSTPPDGKARRRERRKQERIKNKRK